MLESLLNRTTMFANNDITKGTPELNLIQQKPTSKVTLLIAGKKSKRKQKAGAKRRLKHKEYCTLTLPFDPIFNSQSRVLILGSFPSATSREQGFYYGHPQNRFWKILAALFEEQVPIPTEEKKQFLLQHRIALWDVVSSCDIVGCSDSSIKNVIPTDLSLIFNQAPIHQIFAEGAKAYTLYRKHSQPLTGRKAIKLPSTSSANAGWQMKRLLEAWKQILPHLGHEGK